MFPFLHTSATNQFEACAFLKSSPDANYPNIQFHFVPVAVSYDGKTVARTKSGHSFQIHVGTCRSESRGSVMAKTSSTLDQPRIKFNYMTAPNDYSDMRAGIRLAREICGQPAMKDFSGAEVRPGPDVRTDQQLNEFIKENVESAYHPCGTVRMGREDLETSCVDVQGRVIGVKGLRVVDASVFPRVTNGNLNAPVIMVAEKMADFIKKEN